MFTATVLISLCSSQFWVWPAYIQGLRRVPRGISVRAVHAGHRHRRLPASAPHRRQGRELQSVKTPPPNIGIGPHKRVSHHEDKQRRVYLSTEWQPSDPFISIFYFFLFFRLIISYVSSQIDDVICFPLAFRTLWHVISKSLRLINFECFDYRDKLCMIVDTDGNEQEEGQKEEL